MSRFYRVPTETPCVRQSTEAIAIHAMTQSHDVGHGRQVLPRTSQAPCYPGSNGVDVTDESQT